MCGQSPCGGLTRQQVRAVVPLLPGVKPHHHAALSLSVVQANMGVAVKFLDPQEDAPAAVAAHQTVGHFRDAAAICDFAAGCDVLTVEIEHVDAAALDTAGKASGVDVEPTPFTLRTIQV
eukprot:GHRQ01030620.1.p3 GENE.GHRQ01030620.1~~GHRQ01030620.1.p3  ORF type:complete len:120 (-),score=25.70 GHRQ01030620.1:501-860(-)